MNLLIKNKNQWSIRCDGQRHTFTNLVKKSTKLRFELRDPCSCMGFNIFHGIIVIFINNLHIDFWIFTMVQT